MADIFQEDFFTRVTNVHWGDNARGVFVCGDVCCTVAISSDGFSWRSLGSLQFKDGGGITGGAYGGGVFFLAGFFDPEDDSVHNGALTMAKYDGISFTTVDKISPGADDDFLSFDTPVLFNGSTFTYQFNDNGILSGRSSSAGANPRPNGSDNPTKWNALPAGKMTVGPSNHRVTLQPNGFEVVLIQNGQRQVVQSALPTPPLFLCYGGMEGNKRAFVAACQALDLGDHDDPSTKIYASTDAISWVPVFTMPLGSVTALIGGLPKSLRKTA